MNVEFHSFRSGDIRMFGVEAIPIMAMSLPGNSGDQTLDYHIVDVFTETALKGNGLAVVFDTVGLATERMQAIAREFNLSETTFIQRRDRRDREDMKACACASSPRRRNCPSPDIRLWGQPAC